MDVSTVERMNAIAKQGRIIPNRIATYWKGALLEDDTDQDNEARDDGVALRGEGNRTHLAGSLSTGSPYPVDVHLPEEQARGAPPRLLRADEAVRDEPAPGAQMEPDEEPQGARAENIAAVEVRVRGRPSSSDRSRRRRRSGRSKGAQPCGRARTGQETR